ncbi:MAG: SDR family oxidoreductase [Candidatus Eremiobacteraeota bacterium]|nr:SDR family oxidoreductase [Candidatus Eremiobacteraeota bacterium]
MDTALVTGASSGIGEAFARALADRGHDLVLVARSADRLRALAAELAARHGVRAEALAADLSDVAAPDAVVAELAARGLEIGLLVNNAGFGTHGEFASLDARRERDEVVVNAYAPVALTRALLPAMIARKRGAVINVSSTGGFQPVPYMATYGATKAFVLSFSEALAEEVRRYGVRVVALCPGQTETAFFTGIDEARIGRPRRPAQVVATALRALDRGHVVAVDGFANYLLANAGRFAPRFLTARVAAMMERPKSLASR